LRSFGRGLRQRAVQVETEWHCDAGAQECRVISLSR